MNIKDFKINFFQWSLVLVFITLVMPKYSLNSQAFIVLGVAWLLVNSFSEKIKELKKRKGLLWGMLLLYLVLLIGMIYTQNLVQGLDQLKDKLPFLLLPFIMGSTSDLLLKNRNCYLRLFSIAVILMALFALAKSLYFHFTGMGDYFVYSRLGEMLQKHTTYYSLFCVMAVNYFIYDLVKLKKTPKILGVLAIAFLVFFIYLLSARIAIIALMVMALFYIKNYFTQKRQVVFLSLLVVTGLLCTLLFSSNYVSRFQSISKDKTASEHVNQEKELGVRLTHWKSAIETMNGSSYIFGKGTGDGKQGLYEQYRENHFEAGYKNKYNAHNQFLEFLMSNGIIGIGAYLLVLIFTLAYAIRTEDQFGILTVFIVFIFSITESIMERQSGIMLVSLLCNLLVFTNENILTRKLKQIH